MKSFLLFAFAVIISLFINENLAHMECQTGNVTISKNNDLAKVFLAEYASNSNFAWNVFTLNWISHLAKIDEYYMYNLCDCVSSKYYGAIRNESVVFSADKMTIEEAKLDFSFVGIKQNTPVVECVFNNEDFFIMEGYRSNGLENTMDVYLLKKLTGVNGSAIVFLALIQSVKIPPCRVCWKF